MSGTKSPTIPELIDKIHHLRHRAKTEDQARKKLELLKQVLTSTIMPESAPGDRPTNQP